MSSKKPGNGVKMRFSADGLESLYHELLKQYYDHGHLEHASEVASRLEEALAASPEFAQSIRGEEVRSIIAELRGDLPIAIQCREAEIRKILELHARTLNTPSWNYVSQRYDLSDVSDRLDLLAILYDKQGDSERAIAVLLESKEYCQSRQLPFDAQDLLDELEQARSTDPVKEQTHHVPVDLLDDAIRKVYGRFKTPADEILVIDPKSRQFTATVNRLLPENVKASVQDVKRRLLALRRRGETRGGLPRLKR
jgi:hypothetical protein